MAIKVSKRKIPAATSPLTVRASARRKRPAPVGRCPKSGGRLDVIEVPIRAEIPVGAKFRFVGKKNVYQCVKALGNGVPDCENCAFKGAKKRALCSSVVCSANVRSDKLTVRYVFDH